MARTTFNLGAGDTTRMSFGNGILKMSTTGTPSTDMGYVRTAELAIAAEGIDIRVGTPARILQRFHSFQGVTFTVTGLEWNRENLKTFLGAGDTTTVKFFKYNFADDITSLRTIFEHEKPNGDKLTLRLWALRPEGNLTVTFGDDIHEFPFSFTLIAQTQDWATMALSPTPQFFEIEGSVTW